MATGEHRLGHGAISGLVALDLDGPNAVALLHNAGVFLPETAAVKTAGATMPCTPTLASLLKAAPMS